MKYWLMKSEPSVYSIEDLARDRRTRWTQIRNFQARNSMTDGMKVGDLVFFYHSNAEPPGIAGLMRVSAKAAADETQFEKGDYFEPRATREAPVWFAVEVEFVKRAARFVSLEELKGEKRLAKMELLRKGSRLSIQPVTAAQFKVVAKLAGLDGAA